MSGEPMSVTMAELVARQQEWLCRQCSTVFPRPPGFGPLGVLCKCGGIVTPSSQTERLLEDRIEALRAEVEALRADAERYRHLRDWGVPELCVCVNGMPSYIDDTPQSPAGQKLDAAIDAARAEARDG